MAEDSSFDVFCPECNIQVEARVIASGHGGFKSKALNPEDEVDAEYHGNAFHIALCRRCESPFLVKKSLYGVPGEFETVTNESVLYPSTTRLAFGDAVPETVRRAYEQALRCYSSSSFDACALMCRRSLEALCKYFLLDRGPLQAKLEILSGQQIIDSRLVEWAHGIRVVGNEAAHDTDTELSKEDARDALDFAEALLTYVFVLNARFEAFSARRKQKKA